MTRSNIGAALLRSMGRVSYNKYKKRRATYRMIKRTKAKMGLQVYSYKRNCIKTSINQLATVDNIGVITFKLSDLPTYSEFQTLYDSYKIGKIKIRFIPQFNTQSLAVPATGIVVPKLFTIIDKDDGVAPTNINEMREYETVKVTRGMKQHSRIFTPHVSIALLGSGVFSSNGNTTHQWINTSSPNVEHFGIKYAIDAGATGQTALQRFDVECTYYIQFKSYK